MLSYFLRFILFAVESEFGKNNINSILLWLFYLLYNIKMTKFSQ